MRPLYTAAFVCLAASCAMAGTICPGGNSTNFPHNPDPNASGCNTVVTINAGNTLSVTVPDATPYENSEDVLVGLVNNSSSVITSISLTGSGIFGFDGDGLCTFTFASAHGVAGSSYCSSSAVNGVDPQDYAGPTSTFANISASGDTGTVNLGPGLQPGASTFFSLEGIPSSALQGTVTGSTPVSGTPEPGSIALMCVGLATFVGTRRRLAK